jgi:hypothetical protein
MEMDGPAGELVRVAAGMGVWVSVASGILVLVGMMPIAVGVRVAGILVTPITTGVGVNMDGVGVDGRKGVGPGKGWMIQPLQDDSRNINRIGRINFFIFSPLYSLYPAYGTEQSPPIGLLWSRTVCCLRDAELAPGY